jgi:hypothetical protein
LLTFSERHFLSMKTWVRKTLSVGVLAAGALLFGSSVAHADTGQNSWDNNGVANGTQVVAPIKAVTNVAGVGAGILGEGTGSGAAGSWLGSPEGGKVKQDSGDNNGVLNGTQIYLPIDLVTNVTGVGVGVLGEGTGSGAASATESGHVKQGRVAQDSSDNNGVLNGTQIYLPIDQTLNISGVGIGILGEGTGSGAAFDTESGHVKQGRVAQDSSDNNGVLNGTQIYAPIDADTNVCGIGIGVLGEGTGEALCVAGDKSVEGAAQDSSDNNGVLNGTQIIAPIDADTNVCGIGIGVLGEGTGEALCGNAGKGHGDHHGDHGDDNGDDDDVDGDHGTDDGYGDAPRRARQAADTEASPVSGVTDVTKGLNANGLDLGGLLNTLR